MKDWREGWRMGDQVFFCVFSPTEMKLYQNNVTGVRKCDGILTLETDDYFYRRVPASCCGHTKEEAVEVAQAKLKSLVGWRW